MNDDEAPTKPYNSRRLLNRTGAFVALGMVTLFGIAIVLLYFIEIPEKNNNVLLVLLGSLASGVVAIVQWFFGGSLATKSQGEIIAQQTATQAKLVEQMSPDTTTTTTRTSAPITPATVPTADQPAIKPLVRPIEVTQEEWDAMNDAEKGAAVLKFSKP